MFAEVKPVNAMEHSLVSLVLNLPVAHSAESIEYRFVIHRPTKFWLACSGKYH